MKPLYKTVMVIWTEYDPTERGYEIDRIAGEAMDGDAYCSKQDTQAIQEPGHDPDWDGTEFFG